MLGSLTVLYHISEESGIERFDPRPFPEDPSQQGVWAIEERLVHNYLLPRDCPRVTFHCGPETAADDISHHLSGDRNRRVVAIESGWRERAFTTRLCRYTLPGESFELIDPSAGYWVSRDAVVPVSRTLIENPVDELLTSGVELRVVASLWPLHQSISESTLEFSMIRMRNASDPGA